MKQSRLMSWVETTLSTFIGFAVALTAQILVFPLFGFDPPLSHNLMIGAIFTVVSIARGFLIRRLFEALHIRTPLSPGALAIIAERNRQKEVEGFGSHDDLDLLPGELARAGAAYAIFARAHSDENKNKNIWSIALQVWPWTQEWWKPTGFRRDLVKAGALILAELDRMDAERKGKRT